jgi:hypothetical protein
MQVGFHHSIFADTYENQANEQGFTLGDDAKWIEEMGKNLKMLHMHLCISDSEYSKILKRFQNKIIVKSLKPLKGE